MDTRKGYGTAELKKGGYRNDKDHKFLEWVGPIEACDRREAGGYERSCSGAGLVA